MSTTIARATRTDRILDLMAGAETNGIGVREAIAVTSPPPTASPPQLPPPVRGARVRSSRLVVNPDENDFRPFVVAASLPADVRPGA
jgi:hypothetical protein